MRILISTFFLFVCFSFFQSCKTDKKTNANNETSSTTKTQNAATPSSTDGETYFIKGKSFYGISVGDILQEKTNILKEVTLATGEGDFKVFNIHNEAGELLGYALPDPNDESKVGDIVITSSKVSTSAGVKVGMTLAELEKKIGEVEVHGSEIEGRTSAVKDGLMYRLDANFWQYEIEKNKVPMDTKIIEITVQR